MVLMCVFVCPLLLHNMGNDESLGTAKAEALRDKLALICWSRCMDMAGPLMLLWGVMADQSSHSSAHFYQQYVMALPLKEKK